MLSLWQRKHNYETNRDISKMNFEKNRIKDKCKIMNNELPEKQTQYVINHDIKQLLEH